MGKNIKSETADLRQHTEELLIKNSPKSGLQLSAVEIQKLIHELEVRKLELEIQNEEKEKRADELVIADKELAYQNELKEKRADELVIANKELAFQNEEKEKRAAELIIANKELAFQAELIIINKELQKLNAEKDKFFSIIAHDLRSPFNAFLGLTQILAEQVSELNQDQIQKFAVTLRKSATNLYELLGNLLEWSLLQRGVTTLSPISFQLMPKLSESLSSISEMASKKEIEISYNIPENLMVYADEKMLRSIIRNLSSNAVKFTPKGGKISFIAKSTSDDWVEISIQDTGIGMNKEIVENLFKLDADTSRKGTNNEPSTGLGLILCKEFVEKHGGKLLVVSEVEKGSTFSFTLPAKASD